MNKQNQTEHNKKLGGQLIDLYLYSQHNIQFDQDMGRKTKQIEKEPKEDKVPASSKKERAISSDWDIFTDTFKDRLSQFIGLNKEILELQSSVEGNDLSDQINVRKERMANKVEEAATQILKNELTVLQDWIRDQQNALEEEAKKIEKAYEDNRASLLATGAFSEEEVRNQLATVQKKADEKKEVYNNYEDLLARSKDIYS